MGMEQVKGKRLFAPPASNAGSPLPILASANGDKGMKAQGCFLIMGTFSKQATALSPIALILRHSSHS